MAMLQELLEPWAITQDAFRVVIEQSKALMARDATPVDGTANVTMRGDVAVMHVKGPLFRYHSWITSYLGTSSYGEMRKDLQKCIDAQVKAMLVVVDSPGGEVNGCAELADALFAARKQIPNMAVYVSGTGASAAYFLASAVGPIYCSQTSSIGSIGVITTLVDFSKADADAGIKEYELVSTQSPKKSQQPADAGYRGRVQQRIDDMAQVFVNSVARYRGVSTATVLKDYGQGDVFVGQRAVDAGLADGVSDVESVIANLQSKVNQAARAASIIPTNGARKMELKTMARLLKLDEGASEREIETRAQELAAFERDILAGTDAKSAAEAVGKVKAGAEAVAARAQLEQQLKDQKEQALQAEFRSTMKDAFKDGRMSLGDANKILPFLRDEESAKAQAALKGITEQSRKNVLDALCTAHVSEKRLKSIKAYLELLPAKAKTPTAATEPALTEDNARKVSAASDEQVKAASEYTGLDPEKARALLSVKGDSVDEYMKALKKK